MNNVIQIENLWKEYQLGVIGHGTLAHDLQSWWAKLCGKEDPNSKIQLLLSGQEQQIEEDRFLALRDINIEIKEGQVVGIIGKNGAGKSTLLKILSRITAPSRGILKIRGTLSSLLEVGTGFHPELTGRENIYLNGLILGMSKIDIQSKLDDIIDFSGIDQYIDTPVKRYSSGMRVRLGFSVAAFLEPEIFIIDEVLAVGDLAFQKRCFNKIEEINKSGRTIILVSHNMNIIRRLCCFGILLSSGKVIYNGDISTCIDKYIDTGCGLKSSSEKKQQDNDSLAHFIKIKAVDKQGFEKASYDIRNSIDIVCEYEVNKNDTLLDVTFFLKNTVGDIIFMSSTMQEKNTVFFRKNKGIYSSVCRIPENILAEGSFLITVVLSDVYAGKRYDIYEDALYIEVYDTIEGDSARCNYKGGYPGFVRPILKWKTELIS